MQFPVSMQVYADTLRVENTVEECAGRRNDRDVVRRGEAEEVGDGWRECCGEVGCKFVALQVVLIPAYRLC